MSKRFLFRVTVYLGLLFNLFAYPAPVSACSCVGWAKPEEEFIDADAVFIGKVLSVTISTIQDPSGFHADGYWPYEITFEVHKSWRGITTNRATLVTGHGEGDCGYPFVEGNDYLVYAYDLHPSSGTGLATNICTRTAEISNAAEDLSYLNTLPDLPLKFAVSVTRTTQYLITVVLVIVLITFGVIVKRHKKR